MNEMKALSKKNTFHLSKNRQREILYFVKQYPEFKSELKEIDGMRSGLIKMDCTRDVRDDSFVNVIFRRSKLIEKIEIIEESAKEVSEVLWKHLIDSAVTDRSWDFYDLYFHIDCGRNTWYKLKREFLWRVEGKR